MNENLINEQGQKIVDNKLNPPTKEDIRTPFGRGILYKAMDGTEWANPEDAAAQDKQIKDVMYSKMESEVEAGHHR